MQSGKNILIITYWRFDDALIQSYTLPYIKMLREIIGGDNSIFFVTLESPTQLNDKNWKNKTYQNLERSGIIWKPLPYHNFGIKALFVWLGGIIKLWCLILNKKINYIHCWCTPAGAIGYVLSVLSRRMLILDSYEPHAESMVENGTWNRKGLAFKILFLLEKLQSKRATYLIGATQGMRGYALEKYNLKIINDRFFVKPACVDLDLFSLDKRKNGMLLDELNLNEKTVCVYAGKFGGIYLDKEVFQFWKVCHNYLGDVFRVLLLSNHNEKELRSWCTQVGLPWEIIILRFVKHHEIPSYIGLGDFAVCPVKPVPTKRYCTPIKDGEYWAMGLPVIIPQFISDDSFIMTQSGYGYELTDLNDKEYYAAVKKIEYLLNQKSLAENVRKLAIKYRSFDIAKQVYSKIYS